MTKIVKVKIAVSVDSDGDWSATGWSSVKHPDELHDLLSEDVRDPVAHYWIEAELPVPEVATIQATVTEAEP